MNIEWMSLTKLQQISGRINIWAINILSVTLWILGLMMPSDIPISFRCQIYSYIYDTQDTSHFKWKNSCKCMPLKNRSKSQFAFLLLEQNKFRKKTPFLLLMKRIRKKLRNKHEHLYMNVRHTRHMDSIS